MDKEFIFDIYDEEMKGYKDVEFEIQNMDNFIHDDTVMKYRRDLNVKECATKLLGEMVVKPAEARKVGYFKNDFDGLKDFLEIIMEYQETFMKRPGKRKGRRPINVG